jgi:hypothetical protein
MQWDGNYIIGLPLIWRLKDDFRQALGEPLAETRYLLVFQQDDGFGERVVVNREAARLLKGLEVDAAKPAQRLYSL